ncbi:Acyl-coenzyme A oxidase [Actinidia chinensis var. chinensis]|uniref:Acyl-coenzyme A oxidase n=1 Tax=Actinidia chinensis var. chinensis TaxID=1590841 RepID=A0A2R6REK1_ACTCC|nr:Acyl-coenzyme A oxidase [Actinidia chinensis var. chinensis]
MKDFSFILLKNYLGDKMVRKGFRRSCNGDGSASTLSLTGSPYVDNTTSGENRTTLEQQMILQLDKKMARKVKLDHESGKLPRRMSCVNSSEILRSAKSALTHYPRFSLDGKDAMYHSSFRNLPSVTAGGRKLNRGLRKGLNKDSLNPELGKTPCFPATLAGERVVWCKPGVVAKLMGLEAIPVPVHSYTTSKEKWRSSMIKKKNLGKKVERHEMDRRKIMMDRMMSSCSTTGYCVMKPVLVDPANN